MRRMYFLTGANGFVGREILRLLVKQDENSVYCLLRDSKSQSAKEKFEDVLEDIDYANGANAFLIQGDIRKERMGIDEEEYDKLARQVTNIIHSAADVRFNQPLEKIRETNVEGTRHVLNFVESCRKNNPSFSHLDHVSSTFVAGRFKGLFMENGLAHGYGFKNTYEQSKYEAEALVHGRSNDLPVVIYRPSIVLGFSENGKAQRNNVIYPMLKLFTRWNVPVVAANRRTTLDLVPVDFVAQAILYLSGKDQSRGKCFNLAAGIDGDITLGKLLKLVQEELGKKVVLMPPIFWRLIVRPLLKTFKRDFYERSTGTFRAFEPYIWEINPRYSVEEAAKSLAGSGTHFPDSDRFLRACFRYAIESDFGERTIE